MKRFILPILLVALLLVSCEPSYERTEGEASYDSVVFIGVDGAGEWLSKAEGFSQVFSSSSVWTGTATSETPSVSAQNWGSYLHGVSPSVHKCVNASITCERFPYPQYPSVFKILRDVYPNAVLASFAEWNAINYGLIETSAGVYKSSDRRFCSTVYKRRMRNVQHSPLRVQNPVACCGLLLRLEPKEASQNPDVAKGRLNITLRL